MRVLVPLLVIAAVAAAPLAAAEPPPGARIYARFCAACHGPDGAGDGPAARELDPRPRDFRAGKYRFRSTPTGQPARASDLERVVRRGLPGSFMPAFGGALADRDIAEVVTYVLSLGPRRPPLDPEPIAMPSLTEAAPADVAHGRELYLAYGCWKCHGIDGTGRGPSAPELKTDEGRPIHPRNFRHEPLKGGDSQETIARTVLTGLIGTPMPCFAETLVVPREAVEAYVANVPPAVAGELETLRHTAPSAEELAVLDDAAWQALADANVAALARYVASLSRRDRVCSRILRQDPELEARRSWTTEH